VEWDGAAKSFQPLPWRRTEQPNAFTPSLEADGTAKSFQPLPGGGRHSQILSPPPWRGTAQPNPFTPSLEGDGAAGGWVNIELITAFGA